MRRRTRIITEGICSDPSAFMALKHGKRPEVKPCNSFYVRKYAARNQGILTGIFYFRYNFKMTHCPTIWIEDRPGTS